MATRYEDWMRQAQRDLKHARNFPKSAERDSILLFARQNNEGTVSGPY